jgi:hypothetical protein
LCIDQLSIQLSAPKRLSSAAGDGYFEREVYHSVNGGASWKRLPWPENCRINEICALAIGEYQ